MTQLENKKAYGTSIYKIFLNTLHTVSYVENKKLMNHYNVCKVVPEYIYDCDGCRIYFHLFGKKVNGGWQADHILAKTKGGSNDITNLQALNWKSNIKKSDKIDFLNKNIHNLFKSLNKKVDYSKNIKSLRKIYLNETYKVYINTRVEHYSIGTIIEKNNKYILVSFNGKKAKVYPDPELFAVVGKRKRI